MTSVSYVRLPDDPDALVVLDATRRVYAGLSRDGGYRHVVSPLQVDVTDVEGEVVRRAGELGCICKGAIYRGGRCYWVESAEAFEAGLPGPAWMGEPAGAAS